jgi:hypothetical protein
MAITTYSELQTAVKTWSKRQDLDTLVPDFIKLAETRINRNIRIRLMETRVTSDTVASTGYYALPDNFVQMRHFKLNTSPVTDLEYLTPERMDTLWAGTLTGKPKVYTTIGSEVRVGPTPDAVYTMEMVYYKKWDSLSDASPTNTLLADNPDVLLYGALIELSSYVENDKGVMKWTSLFNEAVTAMQTQDDRDRASGSALRAIGDHSVI